MLWIFFLFIYLIYFFLLLVIDILQRKISKESTVMILRKWHGQLIKIKKLVHIGEFFRGEITVCNYTIMFCLATQYLKVSGMSLKTENQKDFWHLQLTSCWSITAGPINVPSAHFGYLFYFFYLFICWDPLPVLPVPYLIFNSHSSSSSFV